ncbi:ashwin-like isoform X1 [Asterias rubens]|uniref:ashwin-like isoform X1 n=1 Tax=Asterias rubens TaxID=7604 RepID=UPI001455A47D|nr:ashwin-like isoform X1 [Asterias rubens]
MASGENEPSTCVDILHPEILSKEDLIDVLSQKNIKLDRPNATKEDLIEIFHRTVTPLPQRQPRPTRRGQAIARVQNRLQAERCMRGDLKEEPSKGTVMYGFQKSSQRSSSLGTSHQTASKHGLSRLKPPPIVINKQKQRTMLLNKSSSSPSKQPVNPACTEEEDKPKPAAKSKINIEHKKIFLSRSPVPSSNSKSPPTLSPTSVIRRDFTTKIKLGSSPRSKIPGVADKIEKISLMSPGTVGSSVAKKTALKRTATKLNGQGSDSGSSEVKVSPQSSEDDGSPKKKFSRISWP